MECPIEMHLLVAKRILRYLQGTKDFEIFYMKGEKSDLVGFTDSDYAGDQDDRKSTSSYVFMIHAGVVSWSSKYKQLSHYQIQKLNLLLLHLVLVKLFGLGETLKSCSTRQEEPL
ncbi:hypothetical protein MTR67_038690 [Solanum verrucosum]|uniref:Reverse transcriptase Ty1/copia-type domain-containing protein n=1 Tax=Solanum verrucosum TaxID=315347 RepID=A0AAF0ZPY1_SOLVR|nr:hypothetical protein MTR67_038690 [Solanum verrucosum]